MNKVLILSDSHQLVEEIALITARHDVPNMIHCGDSELAGDHQVLEGVHTVRGNCDHDERFPEEKVLLIDEITFFVTHGHLHQVKSRTGLANLSDYAKEKKVQVICYGHTHIAGAEKIDGQLFINPGSIRMPRNRKEKTYAILSWNSPTDVLVEFFTVSGVPVKELIYETSFLT
ncbi:MAG TPA: metallophosphoesterase [Virgibacillus sp.]|nr:metallophosphoesterase [Virgibacillus sp.]